VEKEIKEVHIHTSFEHEEEEEEGFLPAIAIEDFSNSNLSMLSLA
jgi:hypothetical protein